MSQRILTSSFFLQLRQVMAGERIVQVALALLGLSALASAFGGPISLTTWCNYLLLLLALFALRWQLQLADSRERPFWNDLTGVYLAWLCHAVLYLTPIDHNLRFYLAAEVILAAGYVAWILVLERQPHRRQRLRPTVLERALAWPAATLFVVGLLTYFVIVPMILERREYLAFNSSMLFYLTLDLYIALRLLHQVQITRSRHWQVIYSMLCLTACTMFAADLSEWLTFDQPSLHRLQPLFSGMQLVTLIVAARLRLYTLPGDHADEDPAAASLVAPSLHTMISAVALPIIHFAGYRLGVLESGTLWARELVISLWIVLLGGFALVQHWLLMGRARLLWIDWARADKALRRSEQKARVVAERLRAKKALQSSEERFDIAFRASPTPSAILSLTLGQFREVNAAFAKLTGYRKHQLIDQTPIELGLWWNHRDAVLFRRGLRGQRRLEVFETRLRTALGDQQDVRLRAEVLEIDAQPCLLVIVQAGQIRDVTASPPDLALATSPLYVVDQRDRLCLWSPSATDLIGWQSAEILNCYAGEILAPSGDTADDEVLVKRQRWRTSSGRRLSLHVSSVSLPQLPSEHESPGRLIVGSPLKSPPPSKAANGPGDAE